MVSKISRQDNESVGTNSESLTVGSSAVTKGHRSGDGKPEDCTHGIIGNNPIVKSVLSQIDVVAPTDSTVLVLGETGTGKELVARAIHKSSPRRNAPFVTLNCAAIPAGLMESELFGHQRGAFTGAVTQRIGRFEAANGGTLFLDEIGDLPLDLQVKLLRVLQEKEFERLGSTHTSRVNVRVVAATNSDLLQRIDDKGFKYEWSLRNTFDNRKQWLASRTARLAGAGRDQRG